MVEAAVMGSLDLVSCVLCPLLVVSHKEGI